jgi:hypothetical protein
MVSEQQKNVMVTAIIVGTIIFIIAAVLIGMALNTVQTPAKPETAATLTADVNAESANGMTGLYGFVVNDRGIGLKTAVQITAYNDHGSQIGQTYVTVNAIEETTTFETVMNVKYDPTTRYTVVAKVTKIL